DQRDMDRSVNFPPAILSRLRSAATLETYLKSIIGEGDSVYELRRRFRAWCRSARPALLSRLLGRDGAHSIGTQAMRCLGGNDAVPVGPQGTFTVTALSGQRS